MNPVERLCCKDTDKPLSMNRCADCPKAHPQEWRLVFKIRNGCYDLIGVHRTDSNLPYNVSGEWVDVSTDIRELRLPAPELVLSIVGDLSRRLDPRRECRHEHVLCVDHGRAGYDICAGCRRERLSSGGDWMPSGQYSTPDERAKWI